MILAIMVFALGVVAAGLIALLLLPAVARRAAGRARKRLEAALPLTRDEISAGKDHLRARHAMQQRRLEQAVGKLNANLAARMVEANAQRETRVVLDRRSAELAATVASQERRLAELSTTLERTEHRLSAANGELVLRLERIAARDGEISHLQSNVAIRDLLTEEQRLELVARETTIQNLNDTLQMLHEGIAAAEGAREALAAETAAARDGLTRQLAAAHQKIVGRDDQIRTLNASYAVLTAERIERLAEIGRLQAELAAFRNETAELRRTLSGRPDLRGDQNVHLRAALADIAAQIARLGQAVAPQPQLRLVAVNGAGNKGHLAGIGAEQAREGPAERPEIAAVPAATAEAASLSERLQALQRAGGRH